MQPLTRHVLLLGGGQTLGLAGAQGPMGLFAAWAVLGLAMGAGLYDAAFATLVGIHGHGARGGITGITLLGVLAWLALMALGPPPAHPHPPAP